MLEPCKTLKIKELKTPKSVPELRHVLGMVNYYQRYIPMMATISEPLHSLLRKGKKWTWGRTEEESWNKIKEAITRGDTLAPFETSSLIKTYLTTDASDVGIGAVLEQEQLDGGIKPVLYWSSKLRKYERNYSVSEKEALACVTAMEKCRKYLLGRRFILKTDYRALVSLLSQRSTKTSSARTERWREKVSSFDYEVEFIKGTDNNIPPLAE